MTAADQNRLHRALWPIAAPQTWSATGFLLSTLFVGVWWFIIVSVVAIAGFATVVLGVGVPLLAAAIAIARTAADSERSRVGAIGIDIAPAHRPTTVDRSAWSLLRSELRNPDTYRNVAHVGLLLILGPIWFSLTVVTWAVPVGLLATPVLLAIGFEPTASSAAGDWEIVVETWSQATIIAFVGALLLPIAPRVVSWMAAAHGRLSLRLLGPGPSVAADSAGRSGRDTRVAAHQGVGR